MFVRLSAVGDAASKTDAYPDIEKLSNQIGPSLTGSTAVRKGAQYVLERMREIGLSHVHTEGWGLTRGWQRGPATASLVSPFSLPIQTAAYGWSGSTPNQSGPARVVLLNADDVAERSMLSRREQAGTGKEPSRISERLRADANLRRTASTRSSSERGTCHRSASSRHAAGAGIVHAEPLSAVLPTRVDPTLIPALDIPSESEELLERLRSGQTRKSGLASRTPSRLALLRPTICRKIEGAVYPEQIVLVGAHLDSWDIGTGATDDGFGVATVLGVAQALIRSQVASRSHDALCSLARSKGYWVATAYVHAHANELSRIIAAFALDWGAGRIVKLPVAGHVELLPLSQQLNQLAPELRLEPPTDGWMFMTDAYAFTLAGVPGIAPLVQSSGYYEQAHSLEDTLDKVNRSDLQQATTVLTLLIFTGRLPQYSVHTLHRSTDPILPDPG